MSTVITPFQGTDSFSTATFNNRISQINTGFSYISNSNLLDNWYFGNPVDQRGGYVVPPGVAYYQMDTTTQIGTTDKYYTALADPHNWQIEIDGTRYWVYRNTAVRGYTGVGYGIDRWMNENDKVVATLENGLLKLTFSGTATYMQKVQVPVGIQLTCSVLVENIDGDIMLLWQDTDNYTDTHELKLSHGMNTLTITTTKQNYRFSIYSNNSNVKTISIKAVKLEIGDTQTLAHQENGNWVLNEIPDYGEQLRRCQRYYNVIRAVSVNSRYGYGTGAGDNICVFVPINVPLRAVPSISMDGDFLAWNGVTPYPAAFRAFDSIATNGVTFSVTSSDMTAGQVFQLLDAGTGNSAIILDANL